MDIHGPGNGNGVSFQGFYLELQIWAWLIKFFSDSENGFKNQRTYLNPFSDRKTDLGQPTISVNLRSRSTYDLWSRKYFNLFLTHCRFSIIGRHGAYVFIVALYPGLRFDNSSISLIYVSKFCLHRELFTIFFTKIIKNCF